METKEPTKEQLLEVVQQLALNTLQLGKTVKDLQARLQRLEHVLTVDAVSRTPIPNVLHTQRDIIGQ